MDNEKQIEMETLAHCLTLAEEEQHHQADKQLNFLTNWQDKLPPGNCDYLLNKFRDIIVTMFSDFYNQPLMSNLHIVDQLSDRQIGQGLLDLFRQGVTVGYIIGKFSEDNDFLSGIPESMEMSREDQEELMHMFERSKALSQEQISEEITKKVFGSEYANFFRRDQENE